MAKNNFESEIMREVFDAISKDIRARLGAIRHPQTGEFPTVLITGDSLETMSVKVEGSEALLSIVAEKLGPEDSERFGLGLKRDSPRAFLSYAYEDRELAERLATALQGAGIDTWWAGWSLSAGDSLRQKIEEGLSDCTHFLVLLTPRSINKPWVNQEIDAGLIQRIERECRFIAVRSDLPPSALSPLLKSAISPEIKDFAADVSQLVSDIHGLSRKPPLGPAPAATSFSSPTYSTAAMAVAKHFVETTQTAVFGDPQLSVNDLSAHCGLSAEDVRDAIYELGDFIRVTFDRALPKDTLFAEFDRFFCGWDPADDALTLAADLVNDPTFPKATADIAQRYDWTPRRLNPAIAWLIARELIQNSKALGTQPWIVGWVQPKPDTTRRFVKSRS